MSIGVFVNKETRKFKMSPSSILSNNIWTAQL